MVIKDIKIFHSEGFQNVPKLGVWFEIKPSGNPDTPAGFDLTAHIFSLLGGRRRRCR
jgi:hypothetical protein